MPIGPGFVAEDNFKVGRGATGQAWTRKASFVVLGPEASDQTHGLTPEQQEHFKDLTVVGATPVLDKGGNRLGVLTVGSKRMLGRRRCHTPAGHLGHEDGGPRPPARPGAPRSHAGAGRMTG